MNLPMALAVREIVDCGVIENEERRLLAEETETAPRRPWRGYVIAVACVLAAFGIRYWLTPVLGEELPFLGFIGAALVAAWSGGVGTGVLALMLGLFLGDWFFVRPGGAVGSVAHSLAWFRLIRYLLTASLGIILIEILHRGQRQTQAAVGELRVEVARRKRSEEALLEAEEQLRRHAEHLESRVAGRTAQLTATVEHLRALLYHIAHDLRAPLRAMSGYTTILTEDYGPKMDETATTYTRRIAEAAGQMDALIADLLEYGRLGHIEVTLNKVSLERALRCVVDRLELELQARQAQVKIAGPLPEVRANPDLVERVLTNLLQNAIKFVPPGRTPQVQVRAEARRAGARLWIEDNGIGIDPQHHERFFGPFQTLHPEQGQAGTGIGLAIVKEAMQRMGGKAGVESQLGGGSRFWVEFPRPDT
jgi:signal transduction histidine kinase